MATNSGRRVIVVEEDFSTDTILVMLVGELLAWFRAAEEVEQALIVLADDPTDASALGTFTTSRQGLLQRPYDWISLHAPEKAEEADIPGQIETIRKTLQRVDFYLMPDRTLPAEQQTNAVRARVRVQSETITAALDRFAADMREMIG